MPGLPGPVESVRIGIRDACVHSLAFCDGLPVRPGRWPNQLLSCCCCFLLFFCCFLFVKFDMIARHQ